MSVKLFSKDALTPRNFLIVAAVVIVIIALSLVVINSPAIRELFTEPDKIKSLVAQAGPWGPLLLVGLQVAQVVVAPIPGQVTGFLTGLLYGPWLGTLYSMIGTAIGFTLVFLVSRRLGRPFIERIFDKNLIRKFDYLTKSNGTMVFFFIFLFPVFPDDLICYLAGLTKIRLSTLIVISLLGRFPGVLLLNFTGSGVGRGSTTVVVAIVALSAIILAIGYWQRDRLEKWAKQLAGDTLGK